MIGLTLVFAALAAVAAGSAGYIDGREYVYRYYGQVYTGYHRIKHQYSGYAFTSDVIIQPHHGDYAIVKVDHVKKAQFNEEFEHVSEGEFHYEDLPQHAEVLTRPFKVYRKHGVITKFEVGSDEPNFSVNLKRGLISLFNLKFEQDETDDNDVQRPDPDAHYYTVNEEGVLGDCETAYIIEHEPYHETPQNNIVLNVTKSRNYHKCSSSPNYVYSTFHGHDCGETELEKSHTLHGNAMYYYNIRGDRHHYVIEHAFTEGEIAYTPYPLEGQTVGTHINRTLHLVSEGPVEHALEVASDLVSYTSLQYNFENKKDFRHPVDLKKPHYLYHAFGTKAPISEIRAQFEELVHAYDDETYHENAKDKNFPAKFLELVRSVATIGYDEINDLYEQYGAMPKDATIKQKLYRNLFVDVIVSLGTNPAFAYGKHLVEEHLLRVDEAAYFIQQISFHAKEVTEVLLDQFQELCDHESVKSSYRLHSTCVLALSNLVHDRCVANLHPEGLPRDFSSCPPEAAVKYFNYIARNYEDTEDEKLKTAYLKAAGNIGVKEAIPYIKPYVEGQGHRSLYIRDTALWALVHVAHRYPEKVRELLVPLFLNHTENYLLRLTAFNLLLQSKPRLHEIESIAELLKHETDDQVRSYIYSTFSHLANSTHPCDRKLARDAHYAMRILNEDHEHFEHYDYTFSQHHYVGGYDKDFDYGGSTRFAYYASDTGYIPRTMYLAFEDYLGGKNMQTFGLGLKQFGLEHVFDRLIGPEGTLGRRSVFDLLKKRSKREASSVEKELNEIKQKLHLPVHEYEPVHGEIFFKYMGNHHSFIHFDDHTFEDYYKDGRFVVPDVAAMLKNVPAFSYQRFMLAVDKFYVIPTEAGLPLIMDYKQPVYIYAKNQEMHLNVEPGLYAEERAGQYPEHVKGLLDAHIILDKNLFATMSVIVPFDQVTFGAGINRRCTLSLPLKLGFDVSVKEKKLFTKFQPVTPHEIYSFKYEPYTFVDSYANSVPMALEDKYMPVRTLHRHDFEKHFFHNALGVGFDVKIDYDNEYNNEGAWLDFLQEKDYRQKFYYLFANPHFEPYHFDITFSKAHEDATDEVDTVFTYNFAKDPYTPGHFQASGFEEYTREEHGHPLYTSAIHAELIGKGTKERKIQAEVAYTRDLTRLYHKLNVYYDRTPFTKEEHDNLKVCASGYMQYPHYDIKRLVDLDTLDVDHTVNSEVKVHFGKDCNSDEKIKIQARFDETEEQHEFERHRGDRDTSEHYNPYAHFYHECEKERAHGAQYGENCLHYMILATTAHHYSFHVKHENLSPAFLNHTYKLGGWLRHRLYDYADHNVIDVHHPEDEIHFEGNFSLRAPIGDLRVIKPHSESHYDHVYLPWYTGLRTYPNIEHVTVKKSFSENKCKIEGDEVITFDHYEYTLPSIDCYKVVAKDCSPNEHFTVLTNKISHPKYFKALKVFLGKHKVEALPVSEDSDLIIRVDGKRVAVTENEPFLHYEDEDSEPAFYVTKRDIYYALHSKKYGVIVEYDGRAVVVEVSPFYRAKLCGLCGNYNGQKYDGYDTTEGCSYDDDASYAYAYSIPSDTCSVPAVQPKCHTDGEHGCTRLRTQVIQLTSGKVPQTCFSTEPVAECTEHCHPTSTVKRELGFHCLPAKDDSTKELLRHQHERVLHEVRRKSRDHEAEVDVPDRCVH